MPRRSLFVAEESARSGTIPDRGGPGVFCQPSAEIAFATPSP